MDDSIPTNANGNQAPEREISKAPVPLFEVVFERERSPYRLEQVEAAARCVRAAMEALRAYPKPDRNQVFEVSMHRAASAELEKLGGYLAAERDFLIDAHVANLQGRARLQAIEGGRAAVRPDRQPR